MQVDFVVAYLTLESPLSSLKLALIAALSFCTTARSSAIVFEARTLRINCFTTNSQPDVAEGLTGGLTRAHIGGLGPRNGPEFWLLPSRSRMDVDYS